jgi:predicted nucleic acid-binding protein
MHRLVTTQHGWVRACCRIQRQIASYLALWLLDIGNLLLSAQRRKRITADKRRELVAAAGTLRLKVDREPVAMTLLDDIAASHGLTAYDAAYLELAIRRNLALATQDAALAAAMVKAGVSAPAGVR